MCNYMRAKYAEFIYKCMKDNNKVLSVVVDSANEEFCEVMKEMPDRVIECGIAEGNALGVAAGLAASGAIPIVYGMGAFLAYRGFEFIRDDICLQNLNVKIVGSGGGVGYNNLGPTHHTTEDIGVLRSLPNMTIVSPASPLEVIPMMKMAMQIEGPVYIRFGKAYEEEIYLCEPQLDFGKANILKTGKDISILCTGSIIADALHASERLEQMGILAEVININFLKPIDEKTIIDTIHKTGKVITVEEHSTIGGLYTIVSEVIAKSKLKCDIEYIGFDNVFCTDYGWRQDIRSLYGISADNIYATAVKMAGQ